MSLTIQEPSIEDINICIHRDGGINQYRISTGYRVAYGENTFTEPGVDMVYIFVPRNIYYEKLFSPSRMGYQDFDDVTSDMKNHAGIDATFEPLEGNPIKIDFLDLLRKPRHEIEGGQITEIYTEEGKFSQNCFEVHGHELTNAIETNLVTIVTDRGTLRLSVMPTKHIPYGLFYFTSFIDNS